MDHTPTNDKIIKDINKKYNSRFSSYESNRKVKLERLQNLNANCAKLVSQYKRKRAYIDKLFDQDSELQDKINSIREKHKTLLQQINKTFKELEELKSFEDHRAEIRLEEYEKSVNEFSRLVKNPSSYVPAKAWSGYKEAQNSLSEQYEKVKGYFEKHFNDNESALDYNIRMEFYRKFYAYYKQNSEFLQKLKKLKNVLTVKIDDVKLYISANKSKGFSETASNAFSEFGKQYLQCLEHLRLD